MSSDTPNDPPVSYDLGGQDGASGSNPGTGDASGGEETQQQVTVNLNEAEVESLYTNYFLVSAAPEELSVNFAFTPRATNQIEITHRVIMSYFTAKRMANALVNAVTQYEQAFGQLELDHNKRRQDQG